MLIGAFPRHCHGQDTRRNLARVRVEMQRAAATVGKQDRPSALNVQGQVPQAGLA